jgi:Zn-dependent peptidase ImmA (M78 family)
VNPESEGSAAAAVFREDHRLGVQPLGDLIALIEQATGIDVAVLDAGPDEHGLTMRDPRRDAVFIGVARTRNPMRQRSTLAHELGHVVFGDWTPNDAGQWSHRSPAEVRADAFARHLLLPLDGLREVLGHGRSVDQAGLSTVVQRFVVSPALAAIALHQGAYIDADTKQEWMAITTPQLAVRFGWNDHYQALQDDANRRRAPQRLLARAVRGYVEGVLPVQAIANLRGITPAAAEAELRDAGIVPAEHPVAWTEADDLPEVQVDLAGLDEDLMATDDSAGPASKTGPG